MTILEFFSKYGSVISCLIRWSVTLFLIFKAYKETGAYTGLYLFLIFVSLEAAAYQLKHIMKVLKELALQVGSIKMWRP